MKNQKKNTPKTPKNPSSAPQNATKVPQTPDFFKPIVQKIEQYPILTLFALALVIGLVAYWRYFTGKYVFYFSDIGSDTVNMLFPERMQLHRLWSESWLPKWSFYEGMGQNRYIGFQTNPFLFIYVLLSRLLGEKFILYGGFYYYFGISTLFGAVVAYAYFRVLELQKIPSIVGALALSYAGYAVLGSSWGHGFFIFNGIILLFLYEVATKYKRPYLLAISFIIISVNLFYLYQYSLFLFFYILARQMGDGRSLRQWLGHTLVLMAWATLGVVINVVNNVGEYSRVLLSPRVAGSVSTVASGKIDASFDPLNYSEFATAILRLFSNDILGNGSFFKGWNNYLEAPAFYIGILALILVPQLFTFIRGRKLYFHAGLLGFVFVLATVPYARQAVQFFVGNYYKGGIDFYVTFSLIFYAIWAFHFIVKEQRIHLVTLISTVLVLLIILFYPYEINKNFPDINNPLDNSVKFLSAFLVLAYASILYFLHTKPNILPLTLLVVFAVELTYSSGFTYNKRKPFRAVQFVRDWAGYKDGSEKAAEFLRKHDTTFFRVEKDYNSGRGEHGSLNDAQVQNYFGTPCYSSFNQGNYIRFLEKTKIITIGEESATRWAPGLRSRPLLQTMANVKYFFTKTDTSFFKMAGYGDSLASFDEVRVYRNKYALPFAFTYNKVLTESSFATLPQLEMDKALLRACVFADDALPKGFERYQVADSGYSYEKFRAETDALKADSLQILDWGQSHFRGKIELKSPKIVFFSIPFDEGWSMTVNGAKMPLVRANLGFTAGVLPAGKSEVVLSFEPPYFAESLWVSGTALVIGLLGVVFVEWRLRQKNRVLA